MADKEGEANGNGAISQSYPLDPKRYKILVEIGRGFTAVTYKAVCIPLKCFVVIKVISLGKTKKDSCIVHMQAQVATKIYHPNVLRPHCYFTVDTCLWVVMPSITCGSVKSIASTRYPDYALPEPCIAAILKQVLTALSYLHDEGHMHRNIKAANILLEPEGTVKLTDSRVSGSFSSATFYDSTGSPPYWMSPEVKRSHRQMPLTGYGFKADIWAFGITALELAHGKPPLSNRAPSNLSVMKITKNFKDMVGWCLERDPSKRPDVASLLKHPFFRNSPEPEFLIEKLLDGVPNIEQRPEARPIFRPNGIGSDEGVDYSPTNGKVYVRPGRKITGWNFNQEWLELDPVYLPDHEDDDDGDDTVAVNGGEKNGTVSSDAAGGGGCGGGAAAATAVTNPILFLSESLEDHRKKLGQVVELLRGCAVDETKKKTQGKLMKEIEKLKREGILMKEIGKLKKEVEDLKKRVFEMEEF